LLFPVGTERDVAYLLGVLSSIPLDWVARRGVEVNLTFHILDGLPIPRPPYESTLRRRVEEIAGILAAVDDRYAAWAARVGVSLGGAGSHERSDMEAELDSVVALLYGLSREQVQHIFSTFHRGWDHTDRLARVLANYDRWEAAAV
jgi:phosphoserine phosphatase